jgi:hypothetical protein
LRYALVHAKQVLKEYYALFLALLLQEFAKEAQHFVPY